MSHFVLAFSPSQAKFPSVVAPQSPLGLGKLLPPASGANQPTAVGAPEQDGAATAQSVLGGAKSALGLGKLIQQVGAPAPAGIDPAVAAGADFGGAVGEAIDPAIAAGADFGGGVAASPAGLPSLGTALQIGGGLVGTGLGALDLSQGQIGPGLGKLGAAGSSFAIGAAPAALLSLPLLAASLAAGRKRETFDSRDLEEIQRSMAASQTFQKELANANSLEDVFTLLRQSHPAVQFDTGPGTGALHLAAGPPGNTPPQLMARLRAANSQMSQNFAAKLQTFGLDLSRPEDKETVAQMLGTLREDLDPSVRLKAAFDAASAA